MGYGSPCHFERLTLAEKERMRLEYALLPRNKAGRPQRGWIRELSKKWRVSPETLKRIVKQGNVHA